MHHSAIFQSELHLLRWKLHETAVALTGDACSQCTQITKAISLPWFTCLCQYWDLSFSRHAVLYIRYVVIWSPTYIKGPKLKRFKPPSISVMYAQTVDLICKPSSESIQFVSQQWNAVIRLHQCTGRSKLCAEDPLFVPGPIIGKHWKRQFQYRVQMRSLLCGNHASYVIENCAKGQNNLSLS